MDHHTAIRLARPTPSRGTRWHHLLIVGAVMVGAVDAHAYGLWRMGAGRADFQAANRYDLAGVPWKAQPGNPVIYDFGNIAFSNDFLTAVGLDLEQLNVAVINAGNFWEQWGNVSFGDASGELSTAMVKLGFEARTGVDVPYAATVGEPAGVTERTSADILFRNTASATAAWTAENFQWTLTHELGHVLGIDDLYLRYAEEFVDHPVAGNDLPDLREIGCQDNVMDRVNTSRHGNCADGAVNDYSKPPTTFIDNDEIAALAWLWGSPYNQIVTGRLDDHWNAADGRDILPHHGDQDGGWWTYRGTIDTPGDEPCIVIDFPGFQDYVMTTFPAVPVRFDGDLHGDGSQQICLTTSNWSGNFELRMKSSLPTEGYVDAVLRFDQSVGRIDRFFAQPAPSALTFTAIDDNRAVWAQLFGPVRIPEPAGLALLAAAWFAARSGLRARRAAPHRPRPGRASGR